MRLHEHFKRGPASCRLQGACREHCSMRSARMVLCDAMTAGGLIAGVNGAPPRMEQAGGCGGFGKGNFSELFKSIEDYEKTLKI